MTTADSSTRLMKSFGEDNITWIQDTEDYGLEPALMIIMRELAVIVGEAPVMFCAGNLIHNVDHANRRFDAAGHEIRPEKPNLYDFTVITDRLVVTTVGHISEDGLSVERETTSVKARKHITGVRVGIERGQLRGSGTVAAHHEVVLTFTDGTTDDIPGAEDELSAPGASKLAELIPSFYADMAA